MFVDKVEISIKAGNGGNGAVSFHREKYVNAGGPDGGDGGKGSDIVFVADDNLSTLIDFRYKKKYVAPDGEPGGAKRCSGKSMEPTVIRVPRGTVIRDAHTGRIMADISDNEPVVVAKGGKGGKGNVHFATPTRQIPRWGEVRCRAGAEASGGRGSGGIPERGEIYAYKRGQRRQAQDR